MAVPEFEVLVLLACTNASEEGRRGPGALASLPYTLEGVSYTFRIDDPAAEKPFALENFWLYLRLSRTNEESGQRELGLAIQFWDTRSGEPEQCFPRPPEEEIPETEDSLVEPIPIFSLGEVPFPGQSPVISMPFRVPNLELPNVGRYEVSLFARREEPDELGNEWEWVGNHYFALTQTRSKS